MGLKSYILKRLAYMVILIFLVATVNFLLFNMMPGTTLNKYVVNLAGRGMSEERLRELEAQYGFDKPLHERYVLYIRNMVTWNFGYSYETKNYVQNDIMMALPNTLILMGVAELGSMIIGILLGVIAAYKRGSSIDTIWLQRP